MNTIYKVIWNVSLGIWIVVSELAKGHTKTKCGVSHTTNRILKEKVLYQICILQTRKLLTLSLLGLGSGFWLNTATALQTISTSGTTGAIVSPGLTTSDTASIYTSFQNTNTPTGSVAASTTSGYAVLIGNNITSSQASNVIVGGNNTAIGTVTMIFGHNNEAVASNSIIIGNRSYSSGNSSIVIGRDSVAIGAQTISMGGVSSALATKAIAIGHSSNASGINSIALGASEGTANAYSVTGPIASGEYTIAVGTSAVSDGVQSIAIGKGATANIDYSIAQGSSAQATGISSIAIGQNTLATGINSIAQGLSANASGVNSIAIGKTTVAGSDNTTAVGPNANASGSKSAALGSSANASAASATALGRLTQATADSATAISNGAKALGISSIAIGEAALANNDYSIAQGSSANASGVSSIAIGQTANAGNDNSIAIGQAALASNDNSIAQGSSAKSSGSNSIAQGSSANASGNYSIAQGSSANASGIYGIAQGSSANASGLNSIAIGKTSIASSDNTTAVGPSANAGGSKSVALGSSSTASGEFSSALGRLTQATAESATAIGNSAQASQINSVALGANATTVTDATAFSSILISGLNFGNFSGVVNDAGMQVSVGGVGSERQIKNVGSGVISNTSTDAINGSQLFATNNILSKVANSTKSVLGGTAVVNTDGSISMTNVGGTGATTINDALIAIQADAGDANTALANNIASALGGGAAYDATTGTWTAPTYQITNLTTGVPSTVNNMGAAISNLDAAVNTPLTFKDGTSGISTNKLGSTFTYIGDANIATTVTQGQLAINLNKNLTGLTSVEVVDATDPTKKTTTTAAGTTVTDGTNTTVYGANGLDINSGAVILDSSGLNAGGVTVSSTGIDANNQSISNIANAVNDGDATNLGQVSSLISDAGKTAADANTALANNMANALGGGAAYDATTGTWAVPTYNVMNPSTGNMSSVNDVGTAISSLDAAVNTPLTFKDASTGTSSNKLGSTFTYIGDANIAATVTQGQLAMSLNKNLTGLTSVEVVDETDPTKKTTTTAAGTTVKDGTNTTVYGANGLNINNGAVVLDSTGLNAGGVTVGSTGINANNQSISNVADAVNDGDATNLGQVSSLITDATNAITDLGFGLQAEDGQTVTKKLGEAINVIGDGQNITTEVKEGQLSIVLAKDLVVDSINAGGSILNSTGLTVGNTQITSDGIFVNGGPSLSTAGIDAGNLVISNVANGVNAGDAINKGQFDEAINGLTENLGSLADSSVQYDKNPDGSVNKNSITLGGENGTLITNLADGNIVTGSKDAVNGGQVADIRDNLQTQITNNTNNITNLQDSIASGTIGLVQQQTPTSEVTVAKDTDGTSVNFTGTSGNRVLTGVQAGNISQNSSDAINGSQLKTSYDALANSLGGNSKFENGVWVGPSYTVGYGDSQKEVNNVGDAVDALNEADQALNTKLANMGTQFDSAIQSTNDRINKLSNKTNAAVAAAIAIASLPQPTEYGNTMLAVGTGVWEGEAGFSVGASGVTMEKKIFNTPVHYVWKFATTTNSRGTWGGGASIGVQWK